jgi:TonB family protein
VLLGGAAALFGGVLGSGARAGSGGGEGGETTGQARYERLRAQGDSLLEQADYQAARQRYRRAQQARPSTEAGSYVDERLREIERRQAAAPQQEGYEQALRQGDSLQARAEAKAAEGNAQSASELYNRASEAYLSALQYRPNDSLALARTRQASARSGSSGAGSAGADESAEETVACSVCGERHEPGLHERVAQMYRSQARQAFQSEAYAEARRKYRSLLDHRPGDEAAEQKIRQINQRISEAEQQKQFQRYRRKGSTLFQQDNLTEARREYQLALDAKPGDEAVKRRLQTIEERLAQQQETQEQYQRHRDEGDTFFEEEKMQKAAESYAKALEYRPEDRHAQERLEEARRLAAAAEKKARRTEEGVYKNPDRRPQIVGGLKALTENVSYPDEARNNEAEGKVFLRITVGTDGRAESVEVIRSSIAFGAPEETVQAARSAEYEPARADGEPVRANKTVMVPFRIR